MREKEGFTGRQKAVLAGCLLAYTAAYLTRLNLSAALGGVAKALSLSDTQAGSFQTAFALVYAAGQLVNGALADRVRIRRHMLLGLIGSALCNGCITLCGRFSQILFFCLLNGAFQSMLWTPIVQTVVLNFKPGPARTKANLIVSLSLVTGHFFAWLVAGWMCDLFGWRLGFAAPAVLALAAAAGVSRLLSGVDRQTERSADAGQREVQAPIGRLLKTGLAFLLAGCVCYGFVRDGIVTWAPKTLSAMGGDFASSLLIPLINVGGILGGFALNRRGVQNVRRCTACMLAAAAVLCALLSVSRGAFLTAAVMGLICAWLYGLNPLLTSLIPMEYDRLHRVGLAAGLVDSLIYCGSALAGTLGGWITDRAGSGMLTAAYFAAAVLGTALIWISSGKKKTDRLKGEQ